MADLGEALLKRVLPHSIEAEQSVIGSMLMDKDAIVAASEILTGEDFYGRQYGIVFEAMVELHDEAKPVDTVTLQNRLKEKDVPPEVSSLEFIKDILNIVPTSANVKYYANIVAEKALLRRLIKTNEEIANTCYVGREPVEDILAETEKKIFQIVQNRNVGDYVPIRQVVADALRKIEIASHNKGAVTGVATGFADLDYRTAGMQPSDRGKTFHGKDRIRVKHCRICGISFQSDSCHLQSGNVEGTACQSPFFLGITRGCAEAEDRRAGR